MSGAHKISVILLLLVSIIFFVITTGILAIKEHEKSNRIRLEGELSITQTNLTKANERIDGLSTQLADETKRADGLSNDLDTQRVETKRLTRELNDKIAQIEELETDLKNKKSKITSLGNEKEEIAAKLSRLGQERNKLEEQIAELENKISKFPDIETIDLGKISVTAMQNIKGDVMAVNKEFGFVIINLGAKDKIARGTILFVYRGDKLVTKVEIDRIYEDMCSANILADWKKLKLKVGDSVKAL